MESLNFSGGFVALKVLSSISQLLRWKVKILRLDKRGRRG